MTNNIWVLTDHRTGNSNQAIALAERLPYKYTIKYLEYNILAKLPNIFIRGTKCFVNNKTAQNIQPPYPKLIISTGRRSAALALYIKGLNPKTRIVQLMKPDAPSKLFDLIALPQHDTFHESPRNMAYIIGALNNVNARLVNAEHDFHKHYPSMNSNFIAILIGGVTKKDNFTAAESHQLAQQMVNICNNHGINAMISFSRRTTPALKEAFIKYFPEPHIIFDPQQNTNYNPYFGMLKCAQFIICAGDSVSMCSEAASTGKPLYIFTPNTFTSRKHLYFIQQLLDLGVAKKLSPATEFLDTYNYQPLDETKQIVERTVKLLDNE